MLNRCSRRHSKKLNNTGSTMMIVMVAISLISILATVLMAMSYMNYNMKVTELNSKKNFYTAEVVLNQISVGLQTEISESMEEAYIRSMQTYSVVDDVTRNSNFANYFVTQLMNELKTETIDTKYQIAPLDRDGDGVEETGLVLYLDDTMRAAYNAGTLKITSTDSEMVSLATQTTDDAGNIIHESSGLVLKNLRIEYTDAKDFMTVIETDIRLKTPALTLATKTAMPEVFDYSLVADAGILGHSNGSTTVFDGNIYAGSDGLNVYDEGGISVTVGHNWTFAGKSRVVSGGPVQIATTSTLNAENETNCWFQSINILKANSTSGQLKLMGSTFVEDDLTVEGKGAKVTLGGRYYGFGNEENTAEGSSAIILNGTNSILDMSALDTLMLGGNAYIQTSSATYTPTANFAADNNRDILLGNSLAVKSDQIAYLVPAECIGVKNNVAQIGKNPMTEAEYIIWRDNNGVDGFEGVSLSKKMNVTGKSINQYSLNSAQGYKTVFRQVNGESLCYLYLDLTADGAATYYKDYYNAAKSKMDTYIQTYNNRILVNPTIADYETMGNVLSYTLDVGDKAGTISILDNTITEGRDVDELEAIREEQDTYQGRFERLQSKLTLEESDVTAEEAARTVYANLINQTAMSGIPSGTKKVYELEDSDGDMIKAVFVNNAGGTNYVYDDTDVCVIVATGSVELTKNFKGLIICDGKIIINGANSVTPDKSSVLKMLRKKESDVEGARSLIAVYFRNGDRYSVDPNASTDINNEMTGLTIGDLIVYENWRKQ